MTNPLATLSARRDRLKAEAELVAARLAEVEEMIRLLGPWEPTAAPSTPIVPSAEPLAACVVSADPPAAPAPPPAEGRPAPKPQARGTAGDLPDRIARALADHGPRTPVRLAEMIGEPGPNVGYHLRRNPDRFERVEKDNPKSPWRLREQGPAPTP